MKFTYLALLALFCVGNAQASSPEEWMEHDKLVRQVCLAKSNLKYTKVLGNPMMFPEMGLSAVVMAGRYPQPHMKNQEGRELCLIDTMGSKVEVGTADDAVMPPQRKGGN